MKQQTYASNITLAETYEIQVIQKDAVGEGELYHPDGYTH